MLRRQVGHLHSVQNSEALREAFQEVQPLVVQTFTKVGQSRAIYNAFDTIRNTPVSLRLLIQPSSAAVARSIVTCPTSPTGAKPRQPANDPDTRCTFSSCSCRQDVWEGLSPPQRRIVASELRSRKKTGVALEGEAQARFNAIKSELAELSTQ